MKSFHNLKNDEKKMPKIIFIGFLCPTCQTIIPSYKRCDGYKDCLYGEDELNCSPEFQCIALPQNVPNPIIPLNEYNFYYELDRQLTQGLNVLVDFYAPWCKACVIFEPKYKSAAAESMRKNLNVIFTKVNTDNNPSLTNYFGVNTFPRLLLFKPGDFERPRRFAFTLPKYLDV